MTEAGASGRKEECTMSDISTNDAVVQIQSVLGEALEGPKQEWSYFTDSGSESGLFGTLDRVSAADASHPTGGTSIAAQAHHASFALDASAAWISGDHSPRDWPQSWSVSEVDEAAWRRLRDDLRGRYGALRRAIDANARGDVEAFGAAVAAVAHAAYHLGAIRQKVAWQRASS
jgi:hypothetical protein